jgi:hypothetical protein
MLLQRVRQKALLVLQRQRCQDRSCDSFFGTLITAQALSTTSGSLSSFNADARALERSPSLSFFQVDDAYPFGAEGFVTALTGMAPLLSTPMEELSAMKDGRQYET